MFWPSRLHIGAPARAMIRRRRAHRCAESTSGAQPFIRLGRLAQHVATTPDRLDVITPADKKGYSSGAWGTYKQWAEARAGPKRPPMSCSTNKSPSMTGKAKAETRLFARSTSVFAAEQVEAFTAPVIETPRNRDSGHRRGRGLHSMLPLTHYKRFPNRPNRGRFPNRRICDS